MTAPRWLYWLYVGAAFAVAAVVRFGVHVLWDALQLNARLASRRERHSYEEDT